MGLTDCGTSLPPQDDCSASGRSLGRSHVRVGNWPLGSCFSEPGVELAAEGRSAVRLGGGEVVGFAWVLGKIIEFVVVVFIEVDKPPGARQDR